MDIEQKRNMREHLIWEKKNIDEYSKRGLVFIKKQSQIRSVSRKSEIKQIDGFFLFMELYFNFTAGIINIDFHCKRDFGRFLFKKLPPIGRES